MDLCGPMHTQSLSGMKYFLILIDQFTGYTSTKFLKQKEETFAAFKEYKVWAENFHQIKITKVVSDGGGEFVNNQFKEYAKMEGFEHSISPAYTPEHNGIAERATSTATFLLNVAPKHDGISPYKKWFDREPPVSNRKMFGCKAWIRIPPIKRQSKFESIVWEGIILLPSPSPTKTLNPISPIPANPLYSPTEPVGEVTDENDSCSECEEEFHDAMEEIPQRRIKIIGPRHPTLIRGDVSE
ncbi:hypothetical protein O181_084083 [Austropuccinia psidii MF-1]|uniref:Integrase catalytic domain-containing protein n=1 Tax=Austropuccinia psidii MF-1 TaxID=1389203 RepID=A0A9Q3FQL2_9BASI|nr:hypothetical protein [Austropuccinia psidii MF-1]